MLFSEARHLVPDLQDYTMEHAHDQVLAIRLMNYDNGNGRELQEIIAKHRTLEQATERLREFSRKQVSDKSHARRLHVE